MLYTDTGLDMYSIPKIFPSQCISHKHVQTCVANHLQMKWMSQQKK